MSACPQCGGGISVPESVQLNEILECPECRAEIEVMSVDPLLIAVAPDVDEDWGE
ncbi:MULTISPECIES: lysine biosynthesis protein LysW [Micromonospora]|uniref:Alpha-aminoadipate carrier protein LysW n=1 Tax=Micromonospora yangpuensis TaxID=683228 RepID=A0A1C6VH14_9ACTN|nr:lysine biosynthesis protein LysW [Micromonospora yangpuensis]GGL99345.1 lysine biosynthesis protein LysW [Micromonospora yangpuensis]SCL65572.1 alpha-aminoadipate carrier protein LysW [Micromonospora yangpuensis]